MRPNNYGESLQVYTFFEGRWQVEPWNGAIANAVNAVIEQKEPDFEHVDDGICIQKKEFKHKATLPLGSFLFMVQVEALCSRHVFLARNAIELIYANDIITILLEI